MTKKVLSIFVILAILTGCGPDLSFETFADSITENSDVYASTDEIIGYIEFDDAKIGLSLTNTVDDEKILILHQLYIDDKTATSATTHGDHLPLGYTISNNKKIWYKALINGEVFQYDEGKTKKHKYAVGILNGNVKDIKYEDSNVKYKTFKFNYLDNHVEVTLWVTQLNENKKFNIENLKF